MEKKLTFSVWEFSVRALTYTWQEGEGKYRTNQGNKNNTNMKKTTIMWEQHQSSWASRYLKIDNTSERGAIMQEE